jgi:UDP-N-acetyl-D-galactosamine dehydrogenase
MNPNNVKIAIFGLGYVGLPLAVKFSNFFNVLGYDLNCDRISQLKLYNDNTNEISKTLLKKVKNLTFTNILKDISNCNVFIVTVPTPINKAKKPNIDSLKKACSDIGKNLNKNNIVIFESTVYPGMTEEVCVPLLEKFSKLKYNKDFFCGYSPERINPGDKVHSIDKIIKVVSGSNKEALEFVNNLYAKIIKAGTHRVSSIRIAEAAKIIENSQRDINIAFMNELSIIFNKLNLDTNEILNAASTKWNFINFKPGLVGGHCIGVDPYYLAHKSLLAGYNPEIILSGRKLNDSMGFYIGKQIISLSKKNIPIKKKYKFLICGFSFKENCKDLRNTKVFDIYKYLAKNKNIVDVYDPVINYEDLQNIYKIKGINNPKNKYYDCVIIAVNHRIFKQMGLKCFNKYLSKGGIFIDIKKLFKNSNSIFSL